MKISIIVATVIGSLLGAFTTYLVLDRANQSSVESVGSTTSENNPESKTEDPFADSVDEPDNYNRLILTDPTDLTQRDMCIALWYTYESATVDSLGVTTGHIFGDVWNRRSPVEILEEQLDFWREFQAESARLEIEQQTRNRHEESKKQNKSEQATPRKPSD